MGNRSSGRSEPTVTDSSRLAPLFSEDAVICAVGRTCHHTQYFTLDPSNPSKLRRRQSSVYWGNNPRRIVQFNFDDRLVFAGIDARHAESPASSWKSFLRIVDPYSDCEVSKQFLPGDFEHKYRHGHGSYAVEGLAILESQEKAFVISSGRSGQFAIIWDVRSRTCGLVEGAPKSFAIHAVPEWNHSLFFGGFEPQGVQHFDFETRKCISEFPVPYSNDTYGMVGDWETTGLLYEVNNSSHLRAWSWRESESVREVRLRENGRAIDFVPEKNLLVVATFASCVEGFDVRKIDEALFSKHVFPSSVTRCVPSHVGLDHFRSLNSVFVLTSCGPDPVRVWSAEGKELSLSSGFVEGFLKYHTLTCCLVVGSEADDSYDSDLGEERFSFVIKQMQGFGDRILVNRSFKLVVFRSLLPTTLALSLI